MHAAEDRAPSGAQIEPATVVAVTGPTAVVQLEGGGTTQARVAVDGYAARPGDRLLVAHGGRGAWAIAVLGALREVTVEAADGARAQLEEGALTVRDGGGRLLFSHRPEEGMSVIHAPHGSLRLEAPGDVELAAGRAVRLRGGAVELEGRKVGLRVDDDNHLGLDRRGLAIAARQLTVSATKARLALLETTFAAELVSTAVGRARHVVGVAETRADRLVERAKNVYRDVEELAQTKAGRIRTIAEGTYHLLGRRALVKASEDVSIKAEQINLA